MLEKYCDILVIGTDLPGLVTAAFLARRGLTVQVIDPDLYSDHHPQPDPICITNKHSKLLRSILGRLNIPEVNIQNFINKESTLQFIYPKHRIDILNNPLAYFEEVEREFPEHSDALKKFYENQAKIRHQFDVNELLQQLIPWTFKEKRVFKKFILDQKLDEKSSDYKQLSSKSDEIARFLEAQYLLAFQGFCESPFQYQVSDLFNPGDGEIFSVHGGLSEIKKMLLDRIGHYDGVVRKKVQINKLLYRNGAFEGVDLDDINGAVLSKYLIWNSSFSSLCDVLPDKWRFKKYSKLKEFENYNYNWFSTSFEVDKTYLPSPLKTNSILIEDETKPLVGGNLVYLQVDQSKNQPKATLWAHFILPHDALEKDNQSFTPYFENIHKRLSWLFPFADKSLKHTFPLIAEEVSSDTLFPLGEDDFQIFKYSAKKHALRTLNPNEFHDLLPLHYRTSIQNFFLSNSLILDGFGIEAKLILGLKITDMIWHEVEKVKKRAMRTEKRRIA